jgi:hypothetical protein
MRRSAEFRFIEPKLHDPVKDIRERAYSARCAVAGLMVGDAFWALVGAT